MTDDDDDRLEDLLTAYHEAAHAVVSMIFGWPTDQVEISGGGRGFHQSGFTAVPLGDTREYVLRLLAGRLGETIIAGKESVADDEWLRLLLDELRASDRQPRFADHDDFKVLRIVVMGDPDGTDSDHIESYRAWEDEARSMLADPDVRGRIEAMADALIRRRTMGEEQTLEIIEEFYSEEANPGERWD